MKHLPSSDGTVSATRANSAKQVFLFLQGPITPYFAEVATQLEARGHRCLRVNFCFGDRLFWRRPGSINFKGTKDAWPAFIADLLDRERVTDIVLLGEQRFYHKVAITAAKARGVKISVTDFGYLRPDWITLERNGMSGESCFPRDPDAIMELARQAPEPDLAPRFHDHFPTQATWDIAYHLLSNWLWWLHPHYKSHQVYHPALVYLGTGRHILQTKLGRKKVDAFIDGLESSGTPYYVLPLQMENDFQLRAYSPYFDFKTPIHDTIRSFAANAANDAKLVIKAHPLDPMMRNWRRIVRRSAEKWGVGDRVEYIDGGNLGKLLGNAKGVVTVNSTVGLWAMRAKTPTITLGQAVYDIEGLTFQGGLDRFWTEGKPPRADLWRAFLKAIAANIQIRGVYYAHEGRMAAVRAAAERLDMTGGAWLELRERAKRNAKQRQAGISPVFGMEDFQSARPATRVI